MISIKHPLNHLVLLGKQMGFMTKSTDKFSLFLLLFLSHLLLLKSVSVYCMDV